MAIVRVLTKIMTAFIISKAGLVFADCQIISGATTVHWDSINFGNVVVQRDVPVGTLLGSQMLNSAQAGDSIIRCDGTQTAVAQMNGNASGPLEHVYDSGVPGVGVKATWINPNGSNGINFDNPPSTLTYTNTNIAMGQGVLIELFKTGTIEPGPFRTGRLFTRTYGTLQAVWGNVSGGQVHQKACTLSQNVINVNLGDWITTDFTGIGSHSQGVDFDIGLDCDSGTRINVNLQGTPDPADPTAIRLSQEPGSATGVGIQIREAGDAFIPLNSKFLLATTDSNGSYVMNWRARYVQTTGVVTGGTANAQATLSISYE